jgi:hypothetical protein
MKAAVKTSDSRQKVVLPSTSVATTSPPCRLPCFLLSVRLMVSVPPITDGAPRFQPVWPELIEEENQSVDSKCKFPSGKSQFGLNFSFSSSRSSASSNPIPKFSIVLSCLSSWYGQGEDRGLQALGWSPVQSAQLSNRKSIRRVYLLVVEWFCSCGDIMFTARSPSSIHHVQVFLFQFHGKICIMFFAKLSSRKYTAG